MFNKVIHFSVHNRYYVLFFSLFLAAYGAIKLQSLPIDAVPDVTNVQVQLNTSVEGLSTEETERRVTFPIENAMRGIAGANMVRSFTRFNLSQVTVIFDEDTDLYRARQMISERLQSIATTLPKGVDAKIAPISSGLGEIYHYTIEADNIASGKERTLQLMELKTLQDWFVKPRLRTVKGVADVNTIGGFEKQFHIQPLPKQLARHGLDFGDLAQALERTNKSVGAGYVRQTGEQFLVQSSGLLKTEQDILEVPVKLLGNFNQLRIKDLAKVAVTTELRTGAALVDGHEAVIGTVMMLIGGNSRTVSQKVDERIKEIQSELPKGYHLRTLYNRSELVNFTIHTVKHNLVMGAFLVIVILFMLVGNMRAALITAFTIPVTLLITFIFMRMFNISGNLMSLGALDFGIIIDGTVILMDHCMRVIQDRRKAQGQPLSHADLKKAIYDAAVQIRATASFGELIIVVVFLPFFSFENVEGKMFHPMAATFIIAILSAFLLSFTMAPALASIFLSGDTVDKEPWIMRKIEALYHPILEKFFKRKTIIVSFGVVATLLGFFLFAKLGGEFLPQLDEGSILIECVRPVKITLDQSVELQSLSAKVVAEFPEVAFTFSKIGTAEIANDPMSVDNGDLYVILKNREEWPLFDGKRRTKEQLVSAIFNKLKEDVPGQTIMLSQPIQNRFNDLLEGTRGDVSIKIFGEDLDVLQDLTNKIKLEVEKIPGIGEVGSDLRGKSPTLKITPNGVIMRKLGISSDDVLSTVGIALGGYSAGYIFDGIKRFSILVKLDETDRSNLSLLKDLPVGFSTTGTVPLKEVAGFEFEEKFGQIKREEGNRRAVVMLSIRGRDMESFVREAQEQISKNVKLPYGYSIKWGGTFANLQAAKIKLLVTVPIVLLMVFLMIYVAFNNIYQVILVFLCAPLAMVGGVLSLMLNHLTFSVSAGVGFIALAGIAVLNGVVLVNYFNELQAEGLSGESMILKGTLLRLRPVLMTALVDIFGFLPMMLSDGVGAEIQRPLASVVIGGVISSTLLTLIVLPVLYSIFEDKMRSVPKTSPEEHYDENHG